MPRRAPRPCTKPGCGALTTTGRCPAHPYPPMKWGKAGRAYDARRGSARARGYDETWDRLSRAYRREHPLCEPCDALGVTTATELVDHRVELRDGGARLDERNLEAMCRACHARKTARAAEERRRGPPGRA